MKTGIDAWLPEPGNKWYGTIRNPDNKHYLHGIAAGMRKSRIAIKIHGYPQDYTIIDLLRDTIKELLCNQT